VLPEAPRSTPSQAPANEPEWAKFIDVAYLNGEYTHAFRDLESTDEASRFARVSFEDAERQKRARRGSLAQAALARAALDDHDLEQPKSARWLARWHVQIHNAGARV
jgi:hypothetical protein